MTSGDEEMDRETAESTAIAALAFIAADAELLPRFLAITGLEPSKIRTAASELGFLAGVLGFIAAHEPTLLAFAKQAGISPQSVQEAMRKLPGGDTGYDRSI